MRRGRESSGVMLATVDKASQFLAYSKNRGCTKLASGVVVGRERWPGGVRSDASQWRERGVTRLSCASKERVRAVRLFGYLCRCDGAVLSGGPVDRLRAAFVYYFQLAAAAGDQRPSRVHRAPSSARSHCFDASNFPGCMRVCDCILSSVPSPNDGLRPVPALLNRVSFVSSKTAADPGTQVLSCPRFRRIVIARRLARVLS